MLTQESEEIRHKENESEEEKENKWVRVCIMDTMTLRKKSKRGDPGQKGGERERRKRRNESRVKNVCLSLGEVKRERGDEGENGRLAQGYDQYQREREIKTDR